MIPKFNLLYFKNLLDIAFNKFFDLYGNCFVKVDYMYMLSKNISASHLSKIFKAIIVSCLKERLQEYDILNPNYYIIIGSCSPKDNMLLKFIDDSTFPKKLKDAIYSKYQLKYLLKEKDIIIDNVKFNEACVLAFNSFFKGNSVEKHFGKKFKKNVLFIKHNDLDCYVMFKVLKNIFGKANCINMQIEHFSDIRSPIVAINELIDRYSNKQLANKDMKFKQTIEEIKTYIKELTQYGN